MNITLLEHYMIYDPTFYDDCVRIDIIVDGELRHSYSEGNRFDNCSVDAYLDALQDQGNTLVISTECVADIGEE